MNLKKILAGILACCVVGGALPFGEMPADNDAVTAHAKESVKQHIWDGTADTSWYYKEHPYIYTGEDSQRIDIFCISTPEELAGLAKLVRNGVTMKDTYINLTADIKLNDTSNFGNWETQPPKNNWIAIGAISMNTPYDDNCAGIKTKIKFPHNTFEGSFNGNGHTISGMYSDHYSYAGLFASISGCVANTVVKDSFVKAHNPSRNDDSSAWPVYAGGIVAYCERDGVISTCEFDGKVKAIGRHYTNNVQRDVAYSLSHECCAGGIVGRIDDGSAMAILGEIIYSYLFGIQVYGFPTTPLIWGSMLESDHVMGVFNCINRGDVSSEYGKSALGAGGIIGTGGLLGTNHKIEPYAIYHCLNEGTVSRPDNNYGAMVGNHDTDSYSCNNFKEIECYYTNCNNSSYPNQAINYTKAGMTKKEVAEKLGEAFKYEGGEIRLNFADSSAAEDTADILTDTFALPKDQVGTMSAPNLNSEKNGDTIKITWDKYASIPAWEYQIAADPDFTDFYEIGVNYSETYRNVQTIQFENLNLDEPYYIRVRGRSDNTVSDTTKYTSWSCLTAGSIMSEVVLGDVNGDNSVDSSDATNVLVDYSLTSTGNESNLTAAQKAAADVDNDGRIDSSDASFILQYYAYSSTGGKETDMSNWMAN